MIHASNLAELNLTQPSLVTIGVFDGLHLGHQTVIHELVTKAKETGCTPVVLTFFPHPDRVIRKLTGSYYLMTPEERAAGLNALGIEVVVTLRFDDELRHIRARNFVEMLVGSLNMRQLWIGEDFALGYQREGNVSYLRALGEELGYTVQTISLVKTDEDDGVITVISSSNIRTALQNGEIEKAARWLGRPYAVRGEVVHGQARGRTLGFPTANIDVWQEKIIPKNGIYAGWATLENGDKYKAVTNVGVRPHFDEQEVTVEAYLLDFDGDLYGQQLEFSFVHYLRGEARFNSLQELIDQIERDAQRGRELLNASEIR
jgi:riboflavin kinase/FMN adenylyltransferase